MGNKDKEGLVSAIVKGAVAGVAGTVVLTGAVKMGPDLLRKAGIDAPEPPAKAKQNKPPKKLADKIAAGAFGTTLNKDEKEVAGQALHWGYGVGWGAFYGLAQSRLNLPHWLHGTLLGTLMIVSAYTLIPAMRIAPPADKVPMDEKVMQGSFIMLYAWTAALVYRVLSRK